jgi:hypothetical protein
MDLRDVLRAFLANPIQLNPISSGEQEFLIAYQTAVGRKWWLFIGHRLPSLKITQIRELLPAHWKPQSADIS